MNADAERPINDDAKITDPPRWADLDGADLAEAAEYGFTLATRIRAAEHRLTRIAICGEEGERTIEQGFGLDRDALTAICDRV